MTTSTSIGAGNFKRHDYLALDFIRPRILGERQIAQWYRYNLPLYVHRERLPTLSTALQASRVPENHTIADLAPLSTTAVPIKPGR
jgi:hypothetical protein